MRFDYGLYIAQAQTEALHVVYVAGRHAKELLEYAFLVFGAYANAVVVHFYNGAFIAVKGLYNNVWVQVAVFNGVVEQVGQRIGKVQLVGHKLLRNGIELRFDKTAFLVQRKRCIAYSLVYNVMYIYRLAFYAEVFLIQPCHLQHTFHLLL